MVSIKATFIKNGMIMVAASLIMYSAGMLMRVWLSGMLGAEGMGIYQLTLSAYAFFALVSSAGITVTVTRLVTELAATKKLPCAAYAAEAVMAASFCLSSLLGIGMFFCADFIGDILGSSLTVPALRILSPSLPLMSVSAAARGYFNAQRKVIAPISEQLIEQAVEIAVTMGAFALIPTGDIENACAYAALGTTAAEAVSFVYILIVYAADVRRLTGSRSRPDALWKAALPIYLPCTASSALRSSLAAVENMLIPAGLMRFGKSKSDSLACYGMITGMAMPVIVFPSVLILPFATLIITEMSSAKARCNASAIKRMSEKAVGVTMKYSIPVCAFMIFFSRGLSSLLYGNEDVALYIAALAPAVPLMYLDSAVDGILKGLGEQTSYMIFNAVDSAIRVALMFSMVPLFGTSAVIFVIVFSELFNTALSLWRLVKVSGLRPDIHRCFIMPVLITVLICLLYRLGISAAGTDPGCIAGIIICSAAYAALIKAAAGLVGALPPRPTAAAQRPGY